MGEAPDEARNLFRQRSRWTKGHMQIFFSFRHCPLMPFNGLNPAMKWLYTNGTWAYFCNIFTTPTFLVVPFISLMFGIHPVIFSRIFAIAALAYLGTNFLVMNYFRWVVLMLLHMPWQHAMHLAAASGLIALASCCCELACVG